MLLLSTTAAIIRPTSSSLVYRLIGSSFRRYSSSLLSVKDIDAPHTGAITVASLNRPDAKNAISKQLLAELTGLVKSIKHGHKPSTRVLILASSVPGIFCAGADLKERKTFTKQDTTEFLDNLKSVLDDIERLAIPTISAIDGLALGGGLEVALSTDFRVLSHSSKVGLPETRLAIIPGAGGTHRLTSLVGPSRALDAVLTGRRIPADEALTWGLASRVTEKALDGALELAKTICEGAPLAINAGKSAVNGATPLAMEQAYATVIYSKDKFEALAAFSEKRKPVFKGE